MNNQDHLTATKDDVRDAYSYEEQNAPYPVRYTKHIIRMATREEYDSQGSLDPLNWDDDEDDNKIEEVNYYIERGDWDMHQC